MNTFVEDRKYKYLEMLQGIIARMASCSFRCKEFYFAIISAILGIFAVNIRDNYIVLYVGVAPCVVFWILDSYYLTQERAFRKLYGAKAALKENDLAFEDFNFKHEKLSISDYWRTFWSKTIWPFYLILFLVLLAGAIIFTLNQSLGFLSFGNEASSVK